MVLEATMLVLDNSEWMRNGDYTPSRWEAQADAVNILFDAKTNSNPENMVGLMTMAGKSPEVLVTLTQDIGKVLSALHESKIAGNSDIATGINVAQLALKHRQNKMQRQRIIVFVGSPVADSTEGLVRLGKKLKKNNVAVDVVNFGEDVENEDKLTQFVDSVNNSDNSHLLTIPSGVQLLSDVILTSPILQEDGDAGPSGAAGGSGGAGGFEFGVDPSMDPELAMALRMSLEEEQARQRAAEGGSTTASGNATASSGGAAVLSSVPETSAPSAALPSAGSLVMAGADSLTGTGAAADDDGEEAMLQQALALSQRSGAGASDEDVQMSDAAAAPDASSRAIVAGAADGDEDEEMTEEEAIARAIEMSLQENQDGAKQ